MSMYDNFRNFQRGNPTINSSNWQADKHQEEQQQSQSSLSKEFADIKDSIARSNAYGAPGHGYQGTRVNGKLAVSRAEAEAMGSGEEYEAKIAETLAEGITRQGGNY